MGALQISDQGTYINEFAWNKVANMLYLESPAGSGQSSGYSTCIKGGIQVPCKWDDVSQAEAYAHSLLAFYKAFPEYAKNDLFLTGESYFGQYGPNIAHWILTHAPFNSTIPLKGIAAGNACWGGDDTHVQCNGPNEELNDLELFHGKGLISNKIYKATKAACQFGVATTESASCSEMLSLVHEAVGPHNIYNLYDNCPGFDLAEAEGMDARELKQKLRLRMLPGGGVEEEQEATPTAATAAREDGKDQAVTSRAAAAAAVASPDRVEAAVAKTGGYAWSCGGMGATSKWITSPAVRKALHLKDKAGSRFGYSCIYNGDADACVPYVGNEEWIGSLEAKGILSEKQAWRPWYTEKGGGGKPPAGYATTYDVKGAPDFDFSFVTIRLAGHMVPTFQPAASLAFFERFLKREPF